MTIYCKKYDIEIFWLQHYKKENQCLKWTNTCLKWLFLNILITQCNFRQKNDTFRHIVLTFPEMYWISPEMQKSDTK